MCIQRKSNKNNIFKIKKKLPSMGLEAASAALWTEMISAMTLHAARSLNSYRIETM